MTQMDIPSYQIGQRSVLPRTLFYIPEAVFCVLLQVVDPLPPVDHSEVSQLYIQPLGEVDFVMVTPNY